MPFTIFCNFEAMKKVVSGIRSTGRLHLGNYFGAVKNFLKMQQENECYFFVADYHSLTTHPSPGDLQENVKRVFVEYVACGLDPDACVLYAQSDVPEIFELYLILNMLAYKGELERVATFKEKVRKQPDNVNAGLLTYPVLMAADILIHRANQVPVGKDQEQHLEMARHLARRFNNMYGAEFFPEPEAFNFGHELVKIPGLDGSGKMGKSEGEKNAIFLSDSPEAIRKKVMRAKTDTGPTAPNSPLTPEIQNLFTLMEAVSPSSTVQHFKEAYKNATIRYGDMKKELAADIIKFADPLRARIEELWGDEGQIKRIRKEGAEKARASAIETIQGARKLIGMQPK